MTDPYTSPQAPQPPPVPPAQPSYQPPPTQPQQTRRSGQGAESWGWVGGLVLILIGLAVLFGNFGIVWGNWWSLIFYLFAVVNFVNAARSWQRTGVFGKQSSGSLTGGLVLTAIGSIFFFELSWIAWWPLILVSVGVGIVLGAVLAGLTGAQGG